MSRASHLSRSIMRRTYPPRPPKTVSISRGWFQHAKQLPRIHTGFNLDFDSAPHHSALIVTVFPLCSHSSHHSLRDCLLTPSLGAGKVNLGHGS